jgi:hypothetical protein
LSGVGKSLAHDVGGLVRKMGTQFVVVRLLDGDIVVVDWCLINREKKKFGRQQKHNKFRSFINS